MATVMTDVFDYAPTEPDEEKYYIDFSVFKPITQRHKFKELQQIAFSKDIGWYGTGQNLEPFNGLNDTGDNIIVVCFKATSDWISKYLAYGKEGEPIAYRDLIRKLRAL
jgi:hypothetical protein